MKKNRTFTIIFFSFIGVVLLVFFYMNFGKKQYNWYESYKSESTQPYGTSFIMNMLKGYTSGEFIYNTKEPLFTLLDSVQRDHAYIFIGESIYLDSINKLALMNFIANGNDALIATPYMAEILPAILLHECVDDIEFHTWNTMSIQTNFFHPEFASKIPYSFTYRFHDDDAMYRWKYLDGNALCDSVKSIIPLGYLDDQHVNFFKIPYGKGNLYIHTNPILFTNYFMTKEINTNYAASVFSHMNYDNIIWDEFSKVPTFNSENSLERSPLYYIMQQQSLRYAWWLLLGAAVLYMLFAAKRKQKIIPVIEPRANTSLQFVTMISSLHYLNQNHSDMARKKMKHFLHHVRAKYGLSTHRIDEEFIKKLSAKSHVSQQEIETIFDHYKLVERFKDITVLRLADLYKHIDNFYKQAK